MRQHHAILNRITVNMKTSQGQTGNCSFLKIQSIIKLYNLNTFINYSSIIKIDNLIKYFIKITCLLVL